MSDNPFLIDVYTKAFEWVGRITDPVSIDGSVRHNALSNFQFRLRAGDPMIEDMLRKGARVTMQYRGAGLMSGVVRTKQGALLPDGDMVFQVQGDWRLLPNTVATIAPGYPITAQTLVASVPPGLAQSWLPGGGADAGPDGTTKGHYGYYLWPDGSAPAGGILVEYAESAIKVIIGQNFTRLGRNVTISPDLLRGGDARAAGMLKPVRMATLSEAVEPLLEWSGLGLRVMQPERGSSVVVDVYEPQEWEAPLTVGSGIIEDGLWTLNPPNATRSVIGGPGEGPDRAFWSVANAALEDEYGDIIEVFRDATSAGLNWPDALADAYRVAKYYLLRPEISNTEKTRFADYLTAAGATGISEGAPTASAQATLSESESFYFGGLDGVQLGDPVTIKTGDELNAQTFRDIVTEAKFSLTAKEFSVVPILGQKLDDPDRDLANAVARLAASQRRIVSSR